MDPRSDLYSMGLILYNCLTGSVPFEAPSAVALARAHVEQAPDPVRSRRGDVPEELDALVLRALAKDPKDRWQSAGEMGTALKRIAHANPGQKTKALAAQHAPMAIDATLPADATVPQPVPHYATAQNDGAVPPQSSRKRWLVAAALLLVGGLVAVALLVSKDAGPGAGADSATVAAENAAPISFSAPIEGVVDTVPQRYRLEAVVGQELTFIIHTGAANGSAAAGVVELTLVTAGGKELALQKSDGADPESMNLSFVAQEAQTIVVVITNRAEAPTPFKLTTIAKPPENAAASGALTAPSAEVSMDNAEEINIADAFEGTVDIEQARHYRFQASPGQTTKLRIYAHVANDETYSAKLQVKVRAEDGSLLQEDEWTTLAHLPDSTRGDQFLEFVTVPAQTALVTIENQSSESPVHYKIVPSPVGTSTKLTGGLTAESAELVDLKAEVVGVANKEQTRFYRFDSLPGQSYEFTVTPEIMQTEVYAATVSLRITGANAAALGTLEVTTLDDIKDDPKTKGSIVFTTVAAQSVLFAIANKSEETPVRYRIASKKIGPSFPLSGSLTPDKAEAVDLKSPIEGVIDFQESRYYRFNAKAGQKTTFTTYSELMRPDDYNASVMVSALAEDHEKLGEGNMTTMANISSLELTKKVITFVSPAAGAVLLILHNTSEESPVHYKFVPEIKTAP